MSEPHSINRKVGGVAVALAGCIVVLMAAAMWSGRVETPTPTPTTTIQKTSPP